MKKKDLEYRIDNADSLEELERAFGRTIKPQKHRKNPFRSKPIPKGKIEWAIQNTKSIRAASKFLGVSYNTFKKYAKMYDLFEQNKNPSGIGTNKGGWLVQECSNCGYSEFRKSDSKSPLILDYIDDDRTNRDLSNLRTLCYNCFFILKLDEKEFKKTPSSPDTMRFNVQRLKTWEDKNKEKEEE